MTKEEAESWLTNLDHDKLVQILQEHRELKNGLCERILGIPCGSDDWIMRSFRKADHLRKCEKQLRITMAGMVKLMEESSLNTLITSCPNCMGSKTINDESCCVCYGTGRRFY